MPEFIAGSIPTARVTFKNPKAVSFAYSTVLYLGKQLGDRVVKSATKNFTIPAGGTLSVDFPVTMPSIPVARDSYHVYLEVGHAGAVLVTFVATEDVVIVSALTLGCSNPKNASTFNWAVDLLNVTTGRWQASGVLGLYQSYVFYPTSDVFLLVITEFFVQDGYQRSIAYGPYLINAPKSGSYVWDAQAEKLSGISSVNMPNVANQCLVGGILSDLSPTSIPPVARIVVDESLNYSGQNWGKYFIGDTIIVETGNFGYEIVDGRPVRVLLSVGTRVQVRLTMEMGQYVHKWRVLNMTKYPEYPPSDYIFNLVKFYVEPHPTQPNQAQREVYTITGNKVPFALVVGQPISQTGYPANRLRTNGPVTNWPGPWGAIVVIYPYGIVIPPVFEVWCHPNTGKTFYDLPAESAIHGWVKLK